MKLNIQTLTEKQKWADADVKIPSYNIQKMIRNTYANPIWLHFGSGNIFRGFIAQLQEQLLEKGLASQGIIACETFDYDIINQIYKPYDNLTMLVGLKPNGIMDKSVIASVADSIKADITDETEMEKLKNIFINKSLQMVSFTITEKGYALYDMKGKLSNLAKYDIEEGPQKVKHAMGMVTSLLYERFKNGAAPIAMVSMDNCSHNGEKLKNAVIEIATKWKDNNFVEEDFLLYVKDETKVACPWSMIDKITPRPAKEVEEMLGNLGIEEMGSVITRKNTFIAPFVNAEIPQYLVIEDTFPNGRPQLEDAGVYMTDRETVNNTERMKVTTCLNPLHTALAVYGCLLGYHQIAAEMKNPLLKGLIEKIGYSEGMPVVVNPKIMDPLDFIHEVIDVRLPNPFIPDMPQRIATDTSQKVAIRFGETIKSYIKSEDLDVTSLTYIPLAIAGWCRYLMGIDDEGNDMEVSSDPMLTQLQGYLAGIKLGDLSSYHNQLNPILSNEVLFAVNLYKVGLGEKIEAMFCEMIEGVGAVKRILEKHIG
ncbi:MAG: mannitol dehydrogenase family protein [Lachnospiraceae bacterium]|nr:mannitol dehydrogenase family protein [Lachnospiraceae bacterium]